ncbi:MAG: DUF4251 domain-containing protein [Mucinivorans sp.]
MKRIFVIIVLLLGVVCSSSETASAQETARASRRERKQMLQIKQALLVENLLAQESFVFVAQRAITTLPNMPYVTLSGVNDFIFTKSQITSRLPFYGRLDSAPIDANQGPLAFTSTDFTYKISDGKKATKIVQIQVKRSKSTMAGGAYSVMLEIFSDATATLNVTIGSGGRSTFFGYVQQINEGI